MTTCSFVSSCSAANCAGGGNASSYVRIGLYRDPDPMPKTSVPKQKSRDQNFVAAENISGLFVPTTPL